MTQKQSRRGFFKKVAYTAPLILTLKVPPPMRGTVPATMDRVVDDVMTTAIATATADKVGSCESSCLL